MHDDWGVRSPRWAGVASKVVDVRGTAVHVLRAGGGPGIPQLLVHGLAASATSWLEVVAPLAEHGPVAVPDLPGFGRTEPPRAGASRIGGNVRFLRALLDTLGWERAIVHGNSMGGTLSVLLASLAPERVARLVLVSPALPFRRRDVRTLDRATLARFAPFVLAPVGDALLRRTFRTLTPEEIWEQSLAYVHGDPSRLSPEILEVGFENFADGIARPWRVEGLSAATGSVVKSVAFGRAVLRAIDAVVAPTLLVWGDADRLVGRSTIDLVRARRPDWDHVELPGVGHAPMIEAPDALLRAVLAWYASGTTEPPAG